MIAGLRAPATLGGRDRSAYRITFTLPPAVAIDELPAAHGTVHVVDASRAGS
jgi:hypothetical protein